MKGTATTPDEFALFWIPAQSTAFYVYLRINASTFAADFFFSAIVVQGMGD
jgi:hypothetical protein